MLFHITHTHTEQTCPAHDPERIKDTFGKFHEKADKLGVKVVSSYIDSPGHNMFFVIDTDKAENIDKLMHLGLTIGTAQVKPVIDWNKAIKWRSQ